MSRITVADLSQFTLADEMIVLLREEQKKINGGTATLCVYNDASYSAGAVIQIGNLERYLQCQSDGTWKIL